MTWIDWTFAFTCLVFAVFHLVVGHIYRDYLSANCASDSYWKKLIELEVDYPISARLIRVVIVGQTLLVLVFMLYKLLSGRG